MQTVTGALHRDSFRDNFWTKVELASDTHKRKTNILLCASYEYLTTKLRAEELSDEVVNNWVSKEVDTLKLQGDSLFNSPTHLEVRALTSEGYQNGLAFLEEKVSKPVIDN